MVVNPCRPIRAGCTSLLQGTAVYKYPCKPKQEKFRGNITTNVMTEYVQMQKARLTLQQMCPEEEGGDDQPVTLSGDVEKMNIGPIYGHNLVVTDGKMNAQLTGEKKSLQFGGKVALKSGASPFDSLGADSKAALLGESALAISSGPRCHTDANADLGEVAAMGAEMEGGVSLDVSIDEGGSIKVNRFALKMQFEFDFGDVKTSGANIKGEVDLVYPCKKGDIQKGAATIKAKVGDAFDMTGFAIAMEYHCEAAEGKARYLFSRPFGQIIILYCFQYDQRESINTVP